jgi:Dyp-type peroxidase family
LTGKPIILNPGDKDVETKEAIEKAKEENDFDFNDNSVCPLAAHIRKTNPRDGTSVTKKARIVRNGIPYGPDFDAKPTEKRGLLFACYQSSIEMGYRFIQKSWANERGFPSSKPTSGLDPFMGQQSSGKLSVNLFKDNKDITGTSLTLSPNLVTMQGGEYFFVPSIDALTGKLAGA